MTTGTRIPLRKEMGMDIGGFLVRPLEDDWQVPFRDHGIAGSGSCDSLNGR